MNSAVEQLLDTVDTLPAWQAFNSCQRRQPDEGGLLSWLDRAIAAHPERIAVQCPDGTLSYAELDQWADVIAAFLIDRGVQPDSIVAIAADRSTSNYAAMLAILRAGCGYLPIEPSDPPQRQDFILADAGAVALLSSAAQLPRFDWLNSRLVLICLCTDQTVAAPAGWQCCERTGQIGPLPRRAYRPERICYLIYTSGTTGLPKGVRIAEGSLINFVHWVQQRHGVQARDRLCQSAPLTFDPSVQQIFPAWVSGACLLPVPEPELHDAAAMLRWLARERISHLDLVTSHWHHLREAAEVDPELRSLPDLRWIIIGGETLYYQHSHHWHSIIESPALLNNIYGPTEATINATEHLVEAEIATGQVPIGRPLPNYRLYVVDSADRLCAVGEVGELLIAGPGLADGYQSAEATEARFGTLDIGDGQLQRVYRSGDLSRLIPHPDGGWTLEFRGRTDSQVKLRGFRIDLTEIEAAAESCPGVRAAAVLLRHQPPDQMVCCYVANDDLASRTLADHLRSRLALSQLPNILLPLERFPLTRNGKLDSRGLAEQVQDALAGRQPVGQPPVGTIEAAVAEVWSEVLDIGMIGRSENLFAIGGDSLLVLSIVRRLRQRQLAVSAADVFDCPTVAALAERCQPAG
ncbi:MAG: non-ribosomal peptide synthetase [Jatrophihabitans sp.]